MSAIIGSGASGIYVPKRSGDMDVACQTENGLNALYASKYGVQGGYFAALIDDGLKTAELLTAIAYYLLGIAQIVRGSLALYWAAKRSQFYKKVNKGLSQRETPDAKAAYIWQVYKTQMSVNQDQVSKSLAEFKKEYDAKGVDAKKAALISDYESELNSWSDYLSNVGFRLQTWGLSLFGKEMRGENTVEKRHAQLRDRIKFIHNQVVSLSQAGASLRELHESLDTFKKERIEDVAQRANLKILGYISSPEFAAELYQNRNLVNTDTTEHQEILLSLYQRVQKDYRATRVTDIVEGIGYVIVGLVSLALVATLKMALARILIGALGSVIYARSMMKGADTLSYIIGMSRKKTFTQEAQQLFNTFKEDQISKSESYYEIYGDE